MIDDPDKPSTGTLPWFIRAAKNRGQFWRHDVTAQKDQNEGDIQHGHVELKEREPHVSRLHGNR